MKSLSRPKKPCPLCSTPTGKRHCSSVHCVWFICLSHSENPYMTVVFDANKKFFIQRTTP